MIASEIGLNKVVTINSCIVLYNLIRKSLLFVLHVLKKDRSQKKRNGAKKGSNQLEVKNNNVSFRRAIISMLDESNLRFCEGTLERPNLNIMNRTVHKLKIRKGNILSYRDISEDLP